MRVLVLLCCGLLTMPAWAGDALTDRAYHAVALLYSQTEDGTMRMHCTATAFETTPTGYLFATAAHCVGNDDMTHERVAKADNIPFYITFDEPKDKMFYPARALEVGYQHRGDDFFVFSVESAAHWPVIPLGDESQIDVTKEDEAAIINVAGPLGLGRQVFRGSISMLVLDRPAIEGDINWRGSMLLAISAGPGSSGSAIISVQQQAIVGFLVGTVGGTNIVGIPVSKFKRFRAQYAQGMYRYAPDPDPEPAK